MEEMDRIIQVPSPSKTKPLSVLQLSHSGEIIRITCGNDEMLGWVKKMVTKLQPLTEAPLKVVQVETSEFQAHLKVRLWINRSYCADWAGRIPAWGCPSSAP